MLLQWYEIRAGNFSYIQSNSTVTRAKSSLHISVIIDLVSGYTSSL